MSVRLALLRHGHTEWNRAGRIQGRTDIPLDPEAEAGLAAMRLPAPWDAAELWASPLQRAVRTAELVGQRAPRVSPVLMEMNWGDWEGAEGAMLRTQAGSGYLDIEDWGWTYRPPGGESPAVLRMRLVPWVEALQKDTVAVCHIGVMRVLLAHATGWQFEGPAPFRVKRNRLYVIEISKGVWHLCEQVPRLVEVPA